MRGNEWENLNGLRMNIMLIGYGKMGKTIERLAVQRKHSIVARVDIGDDFASALATRPDVAIEFTGPDAAYNNIYRCLENNIPVLSGSTGWLNRKPEIEEFCKQQGGSFFYASNYSLGVNIFFKLNEYLARILNNHPEYNISMDEIHHTEKKDAPSGTAISIAEGIIKNLEHKISWVKGEANHDKEIGIRSFRIDQVPGTHVVRFFSEIDDIELKHTAHSRDGFALGAVLVAEWLKDRKGVFSMNDFLPF